MNDRKITLEQMTRFRLYLVHEERSPGTIEKYMRDVSSFAGWLAGRKVTKELVTGWKEHLHAAGYAPSTVNAMLASAHCFFDLQGWADCRVKYLKIQRRLFRNSDRELTRGDYERLIATARERGQERLALLIETIGATGVRVSEVKYITVEAVQHGRSEISMKGKIRTVLIPAKLARKLLKYAKKQKIVSGEIFLTKNENSMSRRQIWASMKRLCQYAGVEASKVFPHNLRHLFATAFYRAYRDITRLADVLGHSSIETTRIYLATSGTEHARQLDRLGLVL